MEPEPEPVAPGQADQEYSYQSLSPRSTFELKKDQKLPSPKVGVAKYPMGGGNIAAPGKSEVQDAAPAKPAEYAVAYPEHDPKTDDVPECCDKTRPLFIKPKDVVSIPAAPIVASIFPSGQPIPCLDNVKPCAMCRKPMKGLMSWATPDTPDERHIVCNNKSYTKDKRNKFFQCSECGIICTFSEYTNTPITITFIDAVEPKAEEYSLPAPFVSNPREDIYDQ